MRKSRGFLFLARSAARGAQARVGRAEQESWDGFMAEVVRAYLAPRMPVALAQSRAKCAEGRTEIVVGRRERCCRLWS